MVSKKYQCRYCDFKTTKAKYRWKHERGMHLNIPTLKKKDHKRCDYCHFEYYENYRITAHIRMVHMKDEGFKCRYCRYSTPEKDNLKNHFENSHRLSPALLTNVTINTNNISTVLPNVSSNVQQTSKEITQIDDNNTSINDQTKEDKIKKCEYCNYSTSNNSCFKAHVECVHLNIKKFKCKRCDYLSYTKNCIIEHLKKVHLKLENEKCNLCNFKGNTENPLSLHVKREHSDEIKCPHCNYVTGQVTYLKIHMQHKHKLKYELKCSYCDYKTSHETILHEHIIVKHYLEPEKNEVQFEQCDVKVEENLDDCNIMMINTSIPGTSSNSHFQIKSEENLSTIKIEEDEMDNEEIPASIKIEEITIDNVTLPLKIKDEIKHENETTTINLEMD